MDSALKFCTVCASNQNRSMEAHKVLKDAGYDVHSFGTGSAVRLPGPSIDKPNVFPFGTPYEQIYKELIAQDPKLHTANGVLRMIERNRDIKRAPERWPYVGQTKPSSNSGGDSKSRSSTPPGSGLPRDLDFNVIFTCEERCFDAVIEDFLARNYFHPDEGFGEIVHVINVEIRDDYQSALLGGQAILELANMLNEAYQDSLKNYDETSEPFADRVTSILATWQSKNPNHPSLYNVCLN
ncbi:unnamed protein product [Kuraishia capsulata CBS 1993]|uniref:RNA polymerase II subunit A C-terminal domain phosphatase SSU72 n=1 Tax=Kuraishia capsulata CBS 1993 TaxID=1382522 RepID=W6MX16_9ASCO|nr:uncharacterized protein KUCA_T00004091001 [Kuraishia capsulata CBS 1993]CDK28110.1 unnamed protein product [Kuraishia capsulata CBS 1993]